MCGISIFINKNYQLHNLENRLSMMNNIAKHRGPDDEGYLIVNINNKANCYSGDDSQVFSLSNEFDYLPKFTLRNNVVDSETKLAFCFRRLSILDTTSAGHQPMSYKNNRYWIVFNGEIYNYIEIRQELIKYGYIFTTNTDTEVIMAAYDYYGPSCCNMFNGMWALSIYDSKKGEIFVSRDRFGIKPLYYYADSNVILFASEIKQFLAFGGLDIQPNIEKIMLDLIVDTKEYTDDTAFSNVFRFPNASYLLYNLNSNSDFEFNKYYSIRFSNVNGYSDFSPKLAIDFSEEYYSLLENSVALRLRSDVEVGTCFSGGLDSSSIIYLVNRILMNNGQVQKQKIFSLVFNDPNTKYCDESYYIDRMAKELNLLSYKTEPSVNDVINNYEQMIYAMDTPQHSTLMSYLFTYKLVKLNNVTVTLDGQGADELQAGYLHYFRYYFANMGLSHLIPQFLNNFGIMEGSGREINEGLIFSLLKGLGLKSAVEKLLDIKKYQTPYTNLNEKLFEEINNNLKTLFHYGDRGSMINSVESRFPMMDYRIVEFWLNLPTSYKIHNGWTKYIARLAFDKKMPDEIVWRRDKKGWEIPQKEWLMNGLGTLIKSEVTNSTFLKDIGIKFNFDNFNWSKSNNRQLKLLIRLYNLSFWNKIFFKDFKYFS